MLNNDDAERLLPPTEKHRREARQRGDVARSSQLTASALLLAASLLLWSYAPVWAGHLISSLQRSASTDPERLLSPPTIESVTNEVGNVLANLLLPSCAILFLVGIVESLIQTGWIWNPSSLVPRWRIQSGVSWERTTDLAGTLARVSVLAGLTWFYVSRQKALILSLGQGEPMTMLVHSVRLIGEFFIQVSMTLLLLGLVDYGICYWRHEKRLMMTPEERRGEQQDDEVDPRIKKQRSAAA